MKKVLLAAFFAMLTFAACEEIEKLPTDEVDENLTNPENPTQGGSSTAELKPDQQKTKISAVGQALINKCPAEDFSTISKLFEDFGKTFFTEDYDFSAMEDWAETHLQGYSATEESGTVQNGITVFENFSELILILSSHKGLFTFGPSKVTVSDYDGAKAVFSMNGKNYEAEISYKGKETTAFLVTYDCWEEKWSDSHTKRSYTTTVSITFPEEIDMKLTENGSELLSLNIKTVASLTESGIVLTTDALSIQATAAMNGYEYVLENISYNGTSNKAGYSMKFKKDGEALISWSALGNVQFDIERDVWVENYESGNYWKDEEDILVAKKAEELSMSADILGQIQLYGTCTDAITASESYDAVWDAVSTWDDEGNRKNIDYDAANRHLKNFNAKFDIGVYYDKGNNKQADIEWELTKKSQEEGWDVNGDGIVNGDDVYVYHNIIPVIVFNDGSRYMLEEFFTETAFGSLLDAVEAYMEELEEIFGIAVEEEVVPQPF